MTQTGLASPAQLRASFARWALLTVPAIVVMGSLMGSLSGSGTSPWYMALEKPAFQPPGWAFGFAWTILYALMGIALAMILNARGAPGRSLAIGVFLAQLILNYSWSPIFFGAHQVTLGLYVIVLMFIGALASAWLFSRIRPLAGLLLLPYLAWLCFAAALNYETDRLNPDAETMIPPSGSVSVGIGPARQLPSGPQDEPQRK